MNNKPLKKVCTKCLDANKQLQLNADFFVEVQYGVCDCCGDRGVVIPFERFFNSNIKLTPCTAEEKVIPRPDEAEENRLETTISLLRENVDKSLAEIHQLSIENMERIDKIEKRHAAEMERLWEADQKNTHAQNVKHPQSQKQAKNSKSGEDVVYE